MTLFISLGLGLRSRRSRLLSGIFLAPNNFTKAGEFPFVDMQYLTLIYRYCYSIVLGSMSTSFELPSRQKYVCNCAQHCRGEPREVSKNTWYRHAPYRNALPPIPVDLIAAHHGMPTTPQSTTLINSANLASSSSNEEEAQSQSHKRLRLDVDTALVRCSRLFFWPWSYVRIQQDHNMEAGGVPGGNMDVGGTADANRDDIQGVFTEIDCRFASLLSVCHSL